jgi:hypothetical protein
MSLLVLGGAAGATPPTVAQLGADFGLDAAAIERVSQGKLVEAFGPETSERDLGVGFVFLIKAPPREVAQAFRRGGDLESDPNLIATHRIGGAASDLDGLRLAPRGTDEAKRYAAAQPGDVLNLSDAELAELHALGGGAAAADVEAALRRLLFARYQAYRQRGLDGIAAYARGGGRERKPADELRRLVELALPLVQKYVPQFASVLAHYPQSRPEGLDEAFYWIVYNLDDRATVTLRHRMTFALGDALVAADREFYVSQGYNSMQALAGILPVEGGTMVFYRCHTSTDRVGGFGSATKRSVGRRIMAKQLEKIFERSRDRFKR